MKKLKRNKRIIKSLSGRMYFLILKVLTFLFIIALIYLLGIQLLYKKNGCENFYVNKDIRCSINFPKYISHLDQRMIYVTLINKSIDKIDLINADIYFPNDPPIVLDPDKHSLFSNFKSLMPNETKTRKIGFYFTKIQSEVIEFCLSIKINEKTILEKNFYMGFTRLCPIPYFNIALKTTWGAIASSIILLLINVYSGIIMNIYVDKKKKIKK